MVSVWLVHCVVMFLAAITYFLQFDDLDCHLPPCLTCVSISVSLPAVGASKSVSSLLNFIKRLADVNAFPDLEELHLQVGVCSLSKGLYMAFITFSLERISNREIGENLGLGCSMRRKRTESSSRSSVGHPSTERNSNASGGTERSSYRPHQTCCQFMSSINVLSVERRNDAVTCRRIRRYSSAFCSSFSYVRYQFFLVICCNFTKIS